MEQKSTQQLIHGIDMLLQKNRASLTVKEIEILEEIKVFLYEIEKEKLREEKKRVVWY